MRPPALVEIQQAFCKGGRGNKQVEVEKVDVNTSVFSGTMFVGCAGVWCFDRDGIEVFSAVLRGGRS